MIRSSKSMDCREIRRILRRWHLNLELVLNRQDMMVQLTKIFEDVMDLDESGLNENSTAADFEEWDSLSHVRLMVSIERAFKIKFTTAEVEGFSRFGDIVTLIEKKGASA